MTTAVRIGNVEADCMSNHERDSFGLKLARVTRARTIVGLVQQFVQNSCASTMNSDAGCRPVRTWIRPPVDVPNAPSSSATYSSGMLWEATPP